MGDMAFVAIGLGVSTFAILLVLVSRIDRI
jgi:hypothetical protein